MSTITTDYTNLYGTSDSYKLNVEASEQTDEKIVLMNSSGDDYVPAAASSDEENIIEQPTLGDEGTKTEITKKALSGSLSACSSIGALVLAVIQQATSDMIRDNREISYEAGMAAADTLENEAENLREQADIQLGIAIACGVLELTSAMGSFAGSAKISEAASEQAAKAAEQFTQGFTSIMKGLNTMTEGIGKSEQTMIDAENKEIEARKERLQALKDQVDSINDSLRQTVESAISSMTAIVQGMNETTKHILA